MPTPDHMSFAVNAAGIADSLRMCQIADEDGAARLEWLSAHFEGWVGVMVQVAAAGEIMEHYRAKRGVNALWGGDLPYPYEIWDSIAQGLWDHLGAEPVDAIVHRAIEQATRIDAA